MNRRSLLKMVAATPIVASGVKAAADFSPEDRLRVAIEELKAAAMAAHPGLVENWTVKVDPKMGCPVLIAGFTA